MKDGEPARGWCQAGLVSLTVCLLLDPEAEAAVRRLWRRLEEDGVPTLLSHTHGRHVPHLTYASLRRSDAVQVYDALLRLEERPPVALHFDGLGTFRRSRCWLAPAVSPDLAERQARVVRAVAETGADVHRHYRPGEWIPHLTLAPRLHLGDLPVVAAAVYAVLPLTALVSTAALVDTTTGEVRLLPHLV